jgi:NADH dehydrogenase FAD-containing subunit
LPDQKCNIDISLGATGVETAAELGFEFGKNKEITLVRLRSPHLHESSRTNKIQITNGSQLLVGAPAPVARFAENELKKLHVKTIKETKITSINTTPSSKTELTLSNGDKMVVDLYLPTIGVIPNTEYVPKNLLNGKGDVMVDQFLRVKNAPDVWAAGDVVDCQPSQFVYAGTSSNPCRPIPPS